MRVLHRLHDKIGTAWGGLMPFADKLGEFGGVFKFFAVFLGLLFCCVLLAWIPGMSKWVLKPELEDHRRVTHIVVDYGGKTLLALSWLVTLFVAFRRIVHSDANLGLLKKAQLEARFAKAVELLGGAMTPGAPNLTAAVSAITVLESVVGKDGGAFDDMVFEVLYQYMRVQGSAPRKEQEAKAGDRHDFASALRVLFAIQRRRFPEETIAFNKMKWDSLPCGGWSGQDRTWPAVDLSGATIDGADLFSADLRKVILVDVTLKGAHLERAVLPPVGGKSDLTDANLSEARLIDVEITSRTWTRAVFRRAELTHLKWVGDTDLIRADFGGASLKDVNFGTADLSGSMWKDARVLGIVDCSRCAVNEPREKIVNQFAEPKPKPESFLWPAFAATAAPAEPAIATAAGGGGSGPVRPPVL